MLRVLLLLGVCVEASCDAVKTNVATRDALERRLREAAMTRFDVREIEGPSGVCFCPPRGTLFVVGDKGDLAEMTTDGAVLHCVRLPNRPDLEGITYASGVGLLYAVVEGAEKILEVEPSSLRVLRDFVLPRTWRGKTVLGKKGQGLEGVAFVPAPGRPDGGTFHVVNQGAKARAGDMPALLQIGIGVNEPHHGKRGAVITDYVELPVCDLSDICWLESEALFAVISDKNDLLLLVTSEGRIVRQAALPGAGQEGFAVDREGSVYIAQDSGGVLKLRHAWPAAAADRGGVPMEESHE